MLLWPTGGAPISTGHWRRPKFRQAVPFWSIHATRNEHRGSIDASLFARPVGRGFYSTAQRFGAGPLCRSLCLPLLRGPVRADDTELPGQWRSDGDYGHQRRPGSVVGRQLSAWLAAAFPPGTNEKIKGVR